MSRFLDARIVNDLFGDPALFLDLRFGRRAILFDLGDVAALSTRELLRVTHVFVSHAHVDHFVGFDRLLRLRLKRDLPLDLVGPADFADRVEAKLSAYTWNLLDETTPDLVVTVREFVGDRLVGQSRFAARQRFAREDTPISDAAPDVVHDEPDFVVRAVELDHKTPCLAFRVEERQRVNVDTTELDRLGLAVGPWINAAKQAIRAGLSDEILIEAGARALPLGLLRQGALRTAPGQVIAYVVDAADTAQNRGRILRLARGADELFIEAAFADEDAGLARDRHHLTAGVSGRLARDAGAKAVIPLHVSTRYTDRPAHVLDQCYVAFGGGAPVSP